MTSDLLSNAFEVLAMHARNEELAQVAAKVLVPLAEKPTMELVPGTARTLLDEAGFTAEDTNTPWGDIGKVLDSGPGNDSERALASALAAHVLAAAKPETRQAEDRLAETFLWLAAHTPYDATSLLSKTMQERPDFWRALGDRIATSGSHGVTTRGEALVGAVAIAMATSPEAQSVASRVANAVSDPLVAIILRRCSPIEPKDGIGESRSPSTTTEALTGELVAPPRTGWSTVLLGSTGLLFLIWTIKLLLRYGLSLRRPAALTLTPEGVRIDTHIELLGRTVRSQSIAMPRARIARIVREVRFASAAFYAGLFALITGSWLGVYLFVDGVRAASVSLLAIGVLVTLLGVTLDFVLTRASSSVRGECRLIVSQPRGKTLCLAHVRAERADAALMNMMHHVMGGAPPKASPPSGS